MESKKWTNKLLELAEKDIWTWRKNDTDEACEYLMNMFECNEINMTKVNIDAILHILTLYRDHYGRGEYVAYELEFYNLFKATLYKLGILKIIK